MKIHKALKVKNRLAGEVANLQEILRRENSRRNDNPSQVNPVVVEDQLRAKRAELFTLKGAIARATAPLAPKLAELEEKKAEKSFYSGLPTREGEELVAQGLGKDALKYQWTAHINREALDKELEILQNRINLLQDEIDEFNATSDVVM